MSKRVGVIGGGISGLSAAYFALKKGYDVDIFERTNQLGGLASSFDFGNLTIEKYYHFICSGDKKIIEFADELNINKELKFKPTRTAFYCDGKYYPFGTAFDLLMFSPVSLLSRLRFGVNVFISRNQKKWAHLDHTSAKSWLIKAIGERAYNVIWHPLLKVKFGEYYDQISAPWIWHRIHRVARSRKSIFSQEKMGYFEGGSQTFINAINQKIQKMEGNVHLNCNVERIVKKGSCLRVFFNSDQYDDFDRVILAIPLPIAAEILKNLDSGFSEQLAAVKFIGIVCGIFRLSGKVSDAFWLNINDPRIFPNGLIEYTNLNPLDEISPHKIVYIPLYLPIEDSRFSKNENNLKEEFFGILKVIKPELSDDCLINFRVFKSPYAQAICTVGFKDKIPPTRTPIEDLFLLDSVQLYPSDRTLSGLIELAENTINQYF